MINDISEIVAESAANDLRPIMLDVSIIIVNYNTKKLVINCIESIINQTLNLTFEIIVVDNASIDGSPQLIKSTYPQVILIESKTNLGFGRANNLGVTKAQGKYLFFLNSDTILLNNAILALLNFNEKNSAILNIGISGGILLDENKLETGSFGPLPTKARTLKSILGLLPRFDKMNATEHLHFQTNGYLKVGYITGADLFISNSIFKNIGGFDPNIFMYFEETDLQLRLKNANYCNCVISGTQIIHLEGASLNQMNANNRKRLIYTKSMFYYFKKHSKLINFLIFKILFLTIRLTAIFYFKYTWKEKKEYILQIIKS